MIRFIERRSERSAHPVLHIWGRVGVFDLLHPTPQDVMFAVRIDPHTGFNGKHHDDDESGDDDEPQNDSDGLREKEGKASSQDIHAFI